MEVTIEMIIGAGIIVMWVGMWNIDITLQKILRELKK